jgi:general secretion pathway protein D
MIRHLQFYILGSLLALATTAFGQVSPRPITPAEPELQQPEAMIGELILVEDSADQVLKLLEQMTDKIILRRQDLPVSKFTFNSRGALSKREAVLALESLLTLNGIMLTDMGGRFMKAIPATNVNSHVPTLLPGSTLELDPSQQIYAKLFKLDYLNAEQAGTPLVQNLVSQNSSIVPFPKSNALLITDALINLQRIETILADADRPQAVRENVKFIKLEFIQAAEMQDRIDNLIQGPLSSYLEGNTSVTADERTNQLILITHPGNVDMIMDVIESLDVDAAPLTSSEVFQLRQAKAEEVVPIIQDIISGQKEGREEDAQVARENEQANRGSNNNPESPLPTTPSPAASSGFTEANSSLQFSNFVGLAADERTNSIVAYGTQQDLKTLKELIEKIDIPLPQVRIEAIITEVTLNENQAS